jgi:ubiquinol-cytochrome c reductase iron-sulfur subunit
MTSIDQPDLVDEHHPAETGGHATPWPDDVPPNQDDTWYPLRDDPRRAFFMEVKIATLWGITALCGVGLMIDYVTTANTQWMGGLMALGLVTMGIGMLMWANNLLPGHDITASRGVHTSPLVERAAVVESLSRGLDPMMARRGFLVKVLGPALGVFGLGAMFQLASLGPRPGNKLFHTKWYPGARLVDQDGRPLKPGDVLVDGLLTVFPEGYVGDSTSLAVIINIGTNRTSGSQGPASVEVRSGGDGLVAFSKICTHAGCPVSLYNALSHQLVCPCHQSTFDVLSECKPVFGPAPRPLPQLPLSVNPEGYLIALHDFYQPVGPGFWERG